MKKEEEEGIWHNNSIIDATRLRRQGHGPCFPKVMTLA